MLGYRSSFSIYDQSDAVRLVDYVRRDLDLDPKRFPPRRLHAAISAHEERAGVVGAGRRPGVHAAREAGRRRVPRVPAAPARSVRRSTSTTCSCSTVHLFRDHPDVLRALARPVPATCSSTSSRTPTSPSGSSCGCSPRSTATSWWSATGSVPRRGHARSRWATVTPRRSRQVASATTVLSCYGSGDFRPPASCGPHRVERRVRRRDHHARAAGASSRPPDHVHFAGFVRRPHAAAAHDVRHVEGGHGFPCRHVAHVHDGPRSKSVFGPLQRCTQEHADAMWVVSVCTTPKPRARLAGGVARGAVRPPDAAVRRPHGSADRSTGAWSGTSGCIDRLFAELDTEKRGLQLLADHGLHFEHPHHQRGVERTTRPGDGLAVDSRSCCAAIGGARRRCTGSRCSDTTTQGEAALESDRARACDRRARESAAGGSRPATPTWASIDEIVERIQRCSTSRSGRSPGSRPTTSTCARELAAVRAGVVGAARHGDGRRGRARSTSSTAVEAGRCSIAPVYDLDVERTHNFVAEGLVTHNSIYKFRGADYRNLMRFEEVFPEATVIVLEQNYRSTPAHPRRRQRGDRQQRGAPAEAPVDRAGRRRAHHPLPRRGRARRGRVRRARDRRGSSTPRAHRFGDIAVFYRTNAQSRVIEETLVRAGVPYRVVGGVKFYDRREVKDIARLPRARS